MGLTNLGATCYLASTIQQLYMIPEARQAVFTAKVKGSRQTRQPADVQAASHRLIVCVAVRRGYQTQDHAPGAAEDVHLSHGERAVLSWFPGTAWLEAALLLSPEQLFARLHLWRLLMLQESERKAYNPRPFCKTYTMDKQPLNTGEQKDMTEFFTDLITKMEEMSQELVKALQTRRSQETLVFLVKSASRMFVCCRKTQ